MESANCSACGKCFSKALLDEAHWYPFWIHEGGGCPACVQENLLRTLLSKGEPALYEAIQTVWPLDAEAAFGVLPARLRLRADPRFSGQGVTIALVDSGFYPHPDLVRPHNRIRIWADATRHPVTVLRFDAEAAPQWPDWDGARDWQWHGTMTSTVCAGNGFLSHGLYAGLAPAAELVLIQVRDAEGHISNESIARALYWLHEHGPALGVRVVSLSVSGDAVSPLVGNPIDQAVAALVESGISVVAAAGNDGQRNLTPPATAPFALTVGGLDDNNVFGADELTIWHSNYGTASNEVPKPELVAPSIWVAAPVLPGSATAHEALELFAQRGAPGDSSRIAELKLITPHYQHVEGTSFAAPLVASAIACLLEANEKLTPLLIRDVLAETAHFVSGADRCRQGAGALNPGAAVARALAERHSGAACGTRSPEVSAADGVTFSLHDHRASRVQVLGSWNEWRRPGVEASRIEPGLWRTTAVHPPSGRHQYKFLIDGERWLDDPANPEKCHDGAGGLNSTFVVS